MITKKKLSYLNKSRKRFASQRDEARRYQKELIRERNRLINENSNLRKKLQIQEIISYGEVKPQKHHYRWDWFSDTAVMIY